jgi:hypothetical protein
MGSIEQQQGFWTMSRGAWMMETEPATKEAYKSRGSGKNGTSNMYRKRSIKQSLDSGG